MLSFFAPCCVSSGERTLTLLLNCGSLSAAPDGSLQQLLQVMFEHSSVQLVSFTAQDAAGRLSAVEIQKLPPAHCDKPEDALVKERDPKEHSEGQRHKDTVGEDCVVKKYLKWGMQMGSLSAAPGGPKVSYSSSSREVDMQCFIYRLHIIYLFY